LKQALKATRTLPRVKDEGAEGNARLPIQTELPLGVSTGDKLPAFELRDQDGQLVRSADLVGQRFVLYFYPKDDTPGCTKEACGFKDEQPAFVEAGVRVIGVSPDKPATHQKFRSKYGLDFTLLSDPDNALSQALGVWTRKQNYGREYMGIERTTFLVDASGKIQRVWRKVRVAGHVPEVLAVAKG
jgi:thioredoxin-dependent peroxiredoxin